MGKSPLLEYLWTWEHIKNIYQSEWPPDMPVFDHRRYLAREDYGYCGPGHVAPLTPLLSCHSTSTAAQRGLDWAEVEPVAY